MSTPKSNTRQLKRLMRLTVLITLCFCAVCKLPGAEVLPHESSSAMNSPLNGSYTIGGGGDFATITSAADALSANGISGDVTFNIIAGTYGDTIVIDSIPGSGSLGKVVFRPQSGNPDVILHGNHVNITLDGADYVEFERLKFTGAEETAVMLEGHLEGIVFRQNDSRKFLGITSAQNSMTVNLRIVDNIFICQSISPAIYQYAVRLEGRSKNTLVKNNVVNINISGMYLYNQDSLAVEGNRISGAAGPIQTQNEPALLLSNCSGYMLVTRNLLSKANYRVGSHPLIIDNCRSSAGVIANNVSSGAVGVTVANCTGLKVVHNNIFGDEISAVMESDSDLVFANNLISRAEGRFGFGIYIAVSNSDIVCDYNNYFTGMLSSPWFGLDSLFGDFNGVQLNRFGDWKSSSGLDANSTTSRFYSDGIHLTGSSRYNPKLRGMFMGVNEDYDGDARDLVSPFKGPDEPVNVVTPSACGISGNINLSINSVEIYSQDSISWGWWEIANHGTTSAYIQRSTEYDCEVNSGTHGGEFLLSYVAFDSAAGVNRTYCNVTVEVEMPLPVELASFVSHIEGNSVRLAWETISEVNNFGFEVERICRDESSQRIGFVDGVGNSSAAVKYSFNDINVPSGIYKYRLRQIDFNGNFEYFELAEMVSIGVPDKYELTQNYPNPFNPVTTISYGLPDDGIVTFKVYDMLGREVKTLVDEMKTAGYHKIQFSAETLSSGTYFYRLETVTPSGNTFVGVRKCIVMK